MAVVQFHPPGWRLHPTVELITPEQMLEYINHETYKVYVSNHSLNTNVGSKTLRCFRGEFRSTYPEKWQEIQAELALQKLKET